MPYVHFVNAFRHPFKDRDVPSLVCEHYCREKQGTWPVYRRQQNQVNSASKVSFFTSGAERTDREKSAKLIAENLSSA